MKIQKKIESSKINYTDKCKMTNQSEIRNNGEKFRKHQEI